MKFIKKTWTEEQLIAAVKYNSNISEVIRALGLKTLGNNYKTINNYIHKLNLNTSHFNYDRSSQLSQARKNIKQKPLEDVFISNGLYSNTKPIKCRIIKEKLIDYKCKICNIDSWNGQKLSLHLDHINGINTDNTLENLRFLCPNCHSLTSTYCGKNKKNKRQRLNFCLLCNNPIYKTSTHCRSCKSKLQHKNKLKNT